MKALLLKLLIAGAIVGGGAYVITQRKVSLPFASKLQPPENIQGSVEGITENVGQQAQQLSERGQEVSGHVQNVLGAFVQENQDETKTPEEKVPLHEQAFEYGRYEYCKQVIEDYETAHPEN